MTSLPNRRFEVRTKAPNTARLKSHHAELIMREKDITGLDLLAAKQAIEQRAAPTSVGQGVKEDTGVVGIQHEAPLETNRAHQVNQARAGKWLDVV